MTNYPPGFGSAYDLDHVEGPLAEVEIDEECPDCHNADGCGLVRQTCRMGVVVVCTGCDYRRDEYDNA